MPNQVTISQHRRSNGEWQTRWAIQLRLPPDYLLVDTGFKAISAERGCLSAEYSIDRDHLGYELSATFCLEPTKLLLEVIHLHCQGPADKPKPKTRFDIILEDD